MPAFAAQNSIAIKTGDAQTLLAIYQTLYAKINRFAPRTSVNYAATDNTQLPVNFFPAEIFGGTTGTFKEVTSGRQQRVAIARALINEPRIIMCDEPTGNLDSKNTSIVLEIFHQLSKEFVQTIVAVTHDNDFAKSSNGIIEMADGRILEHDLRMEDFKK